MWFISTGLKKEGWGQTHTHAVGVFKAVHFIVWWISLERVMSQIMHCRLTGIEGFKLPELTLAAAFYKHLLPVKSLTKHLVLKNVPQLVKQKPDRHTT